MKDKNKTKEILWFVEAADSIMLNGAEVQFIEHDKETALNDVADNSCDFCEYSFKFCRVYPMQAEAYLGIIEDEYKYLFKDKDKNPYKQIWFKMDFESYEWTQLSDLEYKQEVYNWYLSHDFKNEKEVENAMDKKFGQNWKDGLNVK